MKAHERAVERLKKEGIKKDEVKRRLFEKVYY